MDNIELNAVMMNGDQVITIKGVESIQTRVSNNGRDVTFIYDYGTILIEIYSKKLNTTKNILLPRKFKSYIYNGFRPGYYLDGNTLHIDYAILDGIASYAVMYYAINLSNGKITNETKIDDKKSAKVVADAIGTLWFKNAFVLQYYQMKGMFSSKLETLLERIDYPH